MDWKHIQQQWQAQHEDANGLDVEAVRRRDAKLHAQVRRRDWLETAVALVVGPFFGGVAWHLGAAGNWGGMGAALLLSLWALYVPWHLWLTRRRLPQPQHELPLRDYLRQERDAMLAQARMLEQIWLWYLGPCAVGLVGLVLARGPVTVYKLVYLGVVFAMFAFIGYANRYVARTQFRVLVTQIDQQLDQLDPEVRP